MARLAHRPKVAEAIHGRDFAYLTGLIRDGCLNAEDRGDLADIILDLLTGKARRPAHRPAKDSTKANGFEIAWRLVALCQNGWSKREAAVRQVAQEFGCSDRKVWSYLKQLKDYIRNDEDYEVRLVRQHLHGRFTDDEMGQARDAYDDWLTEHADDPEPTDDEIEAAGDQYLEWLVDFARGK
jgi:hypothetical protein